MTLDRPLATKSSAHVSKATVDWDLTAHTLITGGRVVGHYLGVPSEHQTLPSCRCTTSLSGSTNEKPNYKNCARITLPAKGNWSSSRQREDQLQTQLQQVEAEIAALDSDQASASKEVKERKPAVVQRPRPPLSTMQILSWADHHHRAPGLLADRQERSDSRRPRRQLEECG